MMTIREVSKLTGVSVRTLQYYDNIGLLPPDAKTQAGYRLYDAAALERLQQIMLFRELEFSLKEIQAILSSPDFDREKALTQQIQLLTLKKEHLENLLIFARGLQKSGESIMDFTAFDKERQAQYTAEAKAQWGNTAAWDEFETKQAGRTLETEAALGEGLMSIFAEFGQIKTLAPESAAAQTLVRKLQRYISANYYSCTNQILSGLGVMYAAGDAFTESLDNAGGPGTAAFAAEAIAVYTRRE